MSRERALYILRCSVLEHSMLYHSMLYQLQKVPETEATACAANADMQLHYSAHLSFVFTSRPVRSRACLRTVPVVER